MTTLKKPVIILGAILLVLAVYMLFKNVIFKSGHSLINNSSSNITLKIYYIDEDGRVVNEEKELLSGATLLDDIKLAVEEAAAKPSKDKITNGVTQGVKVRKVYVDDNKCAYIDFEESLITRHIGGTQGELNTLECIKQTVASNFKDIEYIKLLVNGKEIQTIAGHINTGGKIRVK